LKTLLIYFQTSLNLNEWAYLNRVTCQSFQHLEIGSCERLSHLEYNNRLSRQYKQILSQSYKQLIEIQLRKIFPDYNPAIEEKKVTSCLLVRSPNPLPKVYPQLVPYVQYFQIFPLQEGQFVQYPQISRQPHQFFSDSQIQTNSQTTNVRNISERERKNPAKTDIIKEAPKTRPLASNTTFQAEANETKVEDEQSTIVLPLHSGINEEDQLKPRTLFVEDLDETIVEHLTNDSTNLHSNDHINLLDRSTTTVSTISATATESNMNKTFIYLSPNANVEYYELPLTETTTMTLTTSMIKRHKVATFHFGNNSKVEYYEDASLVSTYDIESGDFQSSAITKLATTTTVTTSATTTTTVATKNMPTTMINEPNKSATHSNGTIKYQFNNSKVEYYNENSPVSNSDIKFGNSTTATMIRTETDPNKTPTLTNESVQKFQFNNSKVEYYDEKEELHMTRGERSVAVKSKTLRFESVVVAPTIFYGFLSSIFKTLN
jgi:hypothetical protein